MFWKRRDDFTQVAKGDIVVNPIPVKPEFETMLQMLRDAEKYAYAKEAEVSNNILKYL